MNQENIQPTEIMEINSADEDDCEGIVTVKEEFLGVLTFFFLLLCTLLNSLLNYNMFLLL